MASIEHRDDEAEPVHEHDVEHDDGSAGRVPRERLLVRVLSVRQAAGTSPSLDERHGQAGDASVPERVLRDTSRRARATRTLAPRRRRGCLDFDGFYRTHYPSVVRLAYSLCGSWSIAEELSQEAFITAHARWRRIESFDRPDLWVRRVVINRSISFRRRETSERRAVERIHSERARDVEPILNDESVWQAMRELSPRQAEVLALFYVEDQPLTTVAEILDLGIETVRTHLKRGRAALAEKLHERGHER